MDNLLKQHPKLLYLLILLVLPSLGAAQKIYKYQDENGRWQFTDKPPANQVEAQTVQDAAETKTNTTDLNQQLLDKFKPQTPIEHATLAAVTIETQIGLGSGFFVSNDGYILTNKHVLRTPKKELQRNQQEMKQLDAKIKNYQAQLALEEKQLRLRNKELSDYKKSIDRLSKGRQKNLESENYNLLRQQYRAWKKSVESNKREFQSQKQEYEKQKNDFSRRSTLTKIANRFTIILKDDTKLKARLIELSPKYDLALLKLDDYQTPMLLASANINQLQQGMTVFAIGSPSGKRDHVSKGIVSGRENYFIKTDAKIYPGNSGGPLISEQGQVVGINTMKRITHKFEGLGYAISINTAMEEFGQAFSR